MTGVMLDAGAVIAWLMKEPGHEAVARQLDGALITSVNFAEVVGYFARLGHSPTFVRDMVRSAHLDVLVVDEADAFEAGMAVAITKPAGLSLADRFCVVAARRLKRVALTSDRMWTKVAADLGVTVELIR